MFRKLNTKAIKEGKTSNRLCSNSAVVKPCFNLGTRISSTRIVAAMANIPSDNASILLDAPGIKMWCGIEGMAWFIFKLKGLNLSKREGAVLQCKSKLFILPLQHM